MKVALAYGSLPHYLVFYSKKYGYATKNEYLRTKIKRLMNETNHYAILTPKSRGNFVMRLAELYMALGNHVDMEGLEGRQLLGCKVFLSDAQNQVADLQKSVLYDEYLKNTKLSIVEQPPADGSKVALLVKTGKEDDGSQFLSQRLSDEDARGNSSYLQTLRLFRDYLQGLEGTGMTMERNLLRTWIYVADIDVNYNGVVKARNDIFQAHGLTRDTHFVASTGIGGYSETRHATVAMDFLTYPDETIKEIKYLHALDHLNNTAEYGVAFERGTRLTLKSGLKRFFISGTASIDKHGDVLYRGDVIRQAGRALENIGALLADGGAQMNDIKYFIVYLRDLSDYPFVQNLLSKVYPDIPHIIVYGKICRPEWLIEMECIAEKI